MMKQKIKHTFELGLLLFFSLCLLNSCEDNEIESQNPQLTRYQIETLNHSNILSKAPIMEHLKKIVKDKTKPLDGSCREIYNSDYGFTIDTDHVKHVVDTETGLDSYNFPIARDSTASVALENLILQSNQEGGYDAFIVEYGFTEAEYLNASENFLEGTTTRYLPIDFDAGVFNASELAKMGYVCIELWEQVWVPANEGNLVGVFEQGAYEWVLSSYSCSWVYESSQNDSGGGGGGSSTSGGGGSTNGTTDSTSDPNYITDVVGTPATLYTKQFTTFINGLDVSLQSTINNPDNVTIKINIQNFLEENGYSEEAEAFAMDIIDSMENNSQVDFNTMIEITSIQLLQNFLNDFNNSFSIDSFDVSNNQNGTKTTKFKGKFSNAMIIPVYINIHVTNVLDNPNTVNVIEFELQEVNSFVSGVNLFLDWEQDSYEYSSSGTTTSVTLNGHFDFGVKLGSAEFGFTEDHDIIVTFNNQTGQAIDMQFN